MRRPVIDPSAESAPIPSLFCLYDGCLVACDKATWVPYDPLGKAYVLAHRWVVEHPQFIGPIWRIWRCEIPCGATWSHDPGYGVCDHCGGDVAALRQGRDQSISTVHVGFRGGVCEACGKTLYLHRVVGEALTKPIPARCRKHRRTDSAEIPQAGAEARARSQAAKSRTAGWAEWRSKRPAEWAERAAVTEAGKTRPRRRHAPSNSPN